MTDFRQEAKMKRLTKYVFLFFPFCPFFPSPILTQVLTPRSGLDIQTPQHEHSINTKPSIPKGLVASNDLGCYHILKQTAARFNSKMPMRFNLKYSVLQLKFQLSMAADILKRYHIHLLSLAPGTRSHAGRPKNVF